MKSIYLAGPEVFLPDMVQIFGRKIELCRAYGFEVQLPSESEQKKLLDSDPCERSKLIFEHNVLAMRQADVGIFNLTPFRSPSADVGTVMELGFMAALKKPVFGYTNIQTDYKDRIPLKQPNPSPSQYPISDENGWGIEDLGNADNLMIDEALAIYGSKLIRHETALKIRLHDLAGFEECLKLAQAFTSH